VVNLEGFGLKDMAPAMAPDRYARWIDELKEGSRMRDYDRSRKCRSTAQDQPAFIRGARALLAAHWSQPTHDGRYQIAGDPAHKIVNPTLYRFAEIEACWKRITCPCCGSSQPDRRAPRAGAPGGT